MRYKILFPTGYRDLDYLNDNIDAEVILGNGDVYSVTLFTPENIQALMFKLDLNHFWSDDMIVVKDLKKETILNAIDETMANETFEDVFCEIGDYYKIYRRDFSFDSIESFKTGNILDADIS